MKLIKTVYVYLDAPVIQEIHLYLSYSRIRTAIVIDPSKIGRISGWCLKTKKKSTRPSPTSSPAPSIPPPFFFRRASSVSDRFFSSPQKRAVRCLGNNYLSAVGHYPSLSPSPVYLTPPWALCVCVCVAVVIRCGSMGTNYGRPSDGWSNQRGLARPSSSSTSTRWPAEVRLKLCPASDGGRVLVLKKARCSR